MGAHLPLLPPSIGWDVYWRDWHPAPVDRWRPALEAIRARHNLPAGAWARFALGRNAVFALGADLVVKLTPPFWASDAVREAAALAVVRGRLPVATPALLAQGELDGWSYLVQARLPGELLAGRWQDMAATERAEVAYQHGQVMRALHDLPVPDTAALGFDWAGMLVEQALDVRAELERGGVAGPLLAGLRAYLDARQVSWTAPTALLHGDLHGINMMVERAGGAWRVTGLLDWSDAKVGPTAHEFISPGVHMYRGDRTALHAWYAGYGLPLARAALQHQVTARAVLYYADTFGRLLDRLPGAARAATWTEIACALWHMTDGGRGSTVRS